MTFNPFHVQRDEQGQFSFRTHIDDPQTTYRIFDFVNQIAQVKLYHWSRSVDWINHVGINSLHNWLFFDTPEVTKRQLGRTIRQAVPYKVNRLKGETKENPKAQMQYVWLNREDLQYGLEWMLSMWIWRVDNRWEDIQTSDLPKITANIFEDIASLTEAELIELYVDPVRKGELIGGEPEKEPYWPSVWAEHGLQYERLRNDNERSPLCAVGPEQRGRPPLS